MSLKCDRKTFSCLHLHLRTTLSGTFCRRVKNISSYSNLGNQPLTANSKSGRVSSVVSSSFCSKMHRKYPTFKQPYPEHQSSGLKLVSLNTWHSNPEWHILFRDKKEKKRIGKQKDIMKSPVSNGKKRKITSKLCGSDFYALLKWKILCFSIYAGDQPIWCI